MENGSIVHIDYDLYNADDDVLIETTREAVAKEADSFDENRNYPSHITEYALIELTANCVEHFTYTVPHGRSKD